MKSAAVLMLVLLLAASLPACAATPEELLSAGRADEAIAQLNARIAAAPNDAASYNLLARAYFYLERWDDAARACERSVQLAPGNSDYHMWLGRIYGEKADHSNFLAAASLAGKVREQFEKAVALDAANEKARADLAEFYMEAPGVVGGGKDKALAQARALQPQNAAAALWIEARIAEKDHRTAEAERLFRQAVEVTHGRNEQWLNLASFYLRQNQRDKMEDAINHAVAATARSSQTEVLVDAAGLLFRAGRNFDGAVQYLREYLQSDRKVEAAPAYRAHVLLGNILARQGNRAAAATEYRAALALASSYQPARQALARLGAQ